MNEFSNENIIEQKTENKKEVFAKELETVLLDRMGENNVSGLTIVSDYLSTGDYSVNIMKDGEAIFSAEFGEDKIVLRTNGKTISTNYKTYHEIDNVYSEAVDAFFKNKKDLFAE